jgi:ankyrin repeat protein
MNHFQAAGKGDIQQLRVLLTADNVDDVVGGGWTALHLSVQRSHFECVKHCIEMNANVNAGDLAGFTPLHYASLHGHIDIVRVLLDAKAIVHVKHNGGATPLYNTIKSKHVSVAKLLIDRGQTVKRSTQLVFTSYS